MKAEEKDKPQFEPGYPKAKYKPSGDSCGYEFKLVHSSAEEKTLGAGWHSSPADFGVETCPSHAPDPVIAKKREEFLAAQNVQTVPKKPGRPPTKQANGSDAA